jgi:acetylglutamate kinase
MKHQHYNLTKEDLQQLHILKGKTLVIKYGGSIMDNALAQEEFAEDLLLLTDIGIRIVIVHGGGPEISKWLKKTGIDSRFMNGLRVTDSDTIEIVEMVLSGSVNKKLSSNLSRKGLNTLGISGKDSNLIQAEKKYLHEKDQIVDIGFVGEITAVNYKILLKLIENSIIPVISPIGSDSDGNSYNINADSAAAFISGSLRAEKLLIMTDIDGVYTDIKDPSTLLQSITVDEIKQYTADGIITGGMLPKLECCINALVHGTHSVHLIDGTKGHSLLFELLNAKGTKILLESEENLCQENL